MTETLIHCPYCDAEIPVSEALAVQVRHELEATIRRESDTRQDKAVKEAEARAREALGVELKDLRAQLAEHQEQAKQAQEHELSLRRQARELEERQKNQDLEFERRLERERNAIEKTLRQQLDETQNLKLKEKEKQIEGLRKALDDAKRKSEQGSQETQGEVLELDLEARLVELFPRDAIKAVPKGTRGADLIQGVHNPAGRLCGSILWETKNTKHFQPAWLDKLKEDQRSAGASLAVLVSVERPDQIGEFERMNGVWVASPQAWPAIATALREQLIQVAYARAAGEGKSEKMELLYQYLAGDEFRHRVEAIVEAFSAMQDQLNKERRAMEKQWREREKQLERIIANTAGMYGGVRGLIGGSMPEIEALSLDHAASLEHKPEQ